MGGWGPPPWTMDPYGPEAYWGEPFFETPQEEKQALQEEESALKKELEVIQKRLAELEKAAAGQ